MFEGVFLIKKGINVERSLVKKLWENGFATIRVPASGAGSSRYPMPDIISGNGKRYLAFEVKYTSNKILYVDKHDINELKDFSEIFGAEPYLAVKFNDDKKFYFLIIDDLIMTRSNNYKITRELTLEKGLTLDMLIKNSIKIPLNW